MILKIKKQDLSVCFWFSVISSGIFLLFAANSSWTIYWIDEIFVFLIFFVALLLLILSLIWTTIHMVYSIIKKRRKYYILLPFIPISISILLSIVVPFKSIFHGILYWQNSERYNVVIEMIKNGTIDKKSTVYLPNEYSYLSSSGEIKIIQNEEDFCVIFYTYRAIFEGSTGFMYCTENMTPYKKYGFDNSIADIKSLGKEDWYFVVFY